MPERESTTVSETTSTATPSETDPAVVDTVSTTTSTTTTEDPVIAAKTLTDAFEANTAALHKVKGRTRILSILLALVLLIVVGLGVTVYALRQVQLSACEAGNNVRSGLLHVADTLEASGVAPRPDGRERTEEEIQATREFVADLREDFALRRC